MEQIYYYFLLSFLSYPLSHTFIKKAMTMDMEMPQNTEKYETLSKFFYIPILNFIVSFLYLLWIIVTFKR